ncbi:energy transducer TonB family protein [Pseudooceanicola onchidii]|uniref:energy transducer TonB family protein n=1 Tax=Pseudooceanicola onchidii TaxID=2562279 RepID=UPI0010AB3D19|nr:energy transducer TonB [Pseudooceanicola onchidii]
MIASSKPLKILALVAAGVMHTAVAVALIRDEPVLVEGMAGGQEAQIGSSFADMAAGTMTPEPVEDTTEVVEPEEVETAEIEPVDTPEPEFSEADPVEADLAEAETPDTAEQPTPTDTPVVPEQMAALVPEVPDGALAPVPDIAQPEVAEPEPLTPEVLEAAKPEITETAPVTEPVETLQAQTDVPVTEMSKRPVMRDPAMETPIKRAEAPKPKPNPKPVAKKAPQGNAQQNARAGSTTGSQTATAKAQGVAKGKATESGNAAVSNYPGQVQRKLARVRKPSMNRRGTAWVAFSINASGGLGGVSVSKSSGDARIDQAALKMVQRAAPFPRPPAGAQRRFSVPIQFR